MHERIHAKRMIKTRRVPAVFVACVVVCAIGMPATVVAVDATRTRIVVCGTELPAGARGLGESLFGSVIQNTLGRIGAALRAAGEASTKSSVVHANIEVRPGEPVNCLQIARGRWAKDSATAWADELGRKAHFDGVGDPYLQSRPDFVLHLKLELSADKSALKLVPLSLEYGRHLGDKKKGTRGLSLEISFHGPGQASDHKDAVGTNLVIGDFEPGYRYDLVSGETEEWERRKNRWVPVTDELHPALQEESHWFPTHAPLPIATSKKVASGVSGGGASPGRSGNSGSTSAPVTPGAPKIITVTLAETRSARPMLLFLADVFDSSKDDIQSSLESKLLRSKRDESQLAAAKEKNDQLVSLVTAAADANVAIAKYCEMGAGKKKSEYLEASKNIFVAMNSANFIAGNLGQPLPFTQVPAPSAEEAAPPLVCP